nr:MAG TPA: chromosome partitioning protein [Caudoviricetes sp.]
MPKMPDISSILGEQLRDVPNLGTEGELRELPVEDVHPNPGNFYPPIDANAMEDLQESIQANGVLEPLLVVRDGDGYRLISGHNRLQAVRHLHLYGPDAQRWATVPCRILPPMDELREQTAIIEANRQRVKTPQVLQQEAKELTRLYTERKKAGEDLPGRVRDRVAEDLRISAARASRLAAIDTGLKIPGFQRMWRDGDINESVAYEISKLDLDQQYRLLDYHIDGGRPLNLSTLRRFGAIYHKLCKGACQVTGGSCEIADDMYDDQFWGGEWHCAGCCACCNERDTCATVCKHFEPEETEPEAPERNPAVDDPRLKWETMRDAFSSRVKALREATGLSRKEFAESIGWYAATYSACENGSLPGSERIPRLALALGCTTDYLYGLTDDPNGWAPPAQEPPAPAWRDLEEAWPEIGDAVILCRDNGIGGYDYQAAVCVGSRDDRFPFTDAGDDIHIEDWDSYRWWLPFRAKD